MALARVYLYSDALGMSTSVSVILPQETQNQIGMVGERATGEPPVLYLLHGLSDDDTIWGRRTSIERYAAEEGLAVVMPRVERSFYHDMAHGERYWTYLSEELPMLMQQFFRLSSRREDTFVAGLSMGGYGAFRWALLHPERFAAAASLSGALDVADPDMRSGRPELYATVWGDGDVAGSEADLMAVLRRIDPSDLPALYLACGDDDDLRPSNERFLALAAERGIDLTTDLGPGEHVWEYWDARIQDVLAWLREVRGLPARS